MKRLTILITMLMATSGWAYNEMDLIKFKSINECRGCDLSGADLMGGNFSSAKLDGANLAGAKLNGSNFKYAELRGANLKKAVFVKTNFESANLKKANLENAYINSTDFTLASMEGSNLKNATITNNSSFRYTYLSKANLTNVNFTYGTAIDNISLTDYAGANSAIFCNTTLPWGVLNDGCKDDE